MSVAQGDPESDMLAGMEDYVDPGASNVLMPTGPAEQSTNGVATANNPAYTSLSPAVLLNPKTGKQRAQNDPDLKETQKGVPVGPEEAGSSSYSSLLEKHHRVGKREAASLKRQRDPNEEDEDSPKKKGKFSGAGKGGIIGESVREMRQKAQDEEGLGQVLDLTNDDDDDITITGSQTISKNDGDPRREVCIGIISASINADRVPVVGNKALNTKSTWPPSKITYRRIPGQHRQISVRDKSDKHFGYLDLRIADVLGGLLNGQTANKIRLTFYLQPRPKGDERAGEHISASLPCRITMFCARSAVEGIGKLLKGRGFVLADPPLGLREVKELVNPHIKADSKLQRISGVVHPGTTVAHGGVGSFIQRTEEQVKNDVNNIIDNLPNSEGLAKAEPNTALVRTELMDHQKQALYWMKKMETPYDPQDPSLTGLWKHDDTKGGRQAWYNSISGHEVTELPRNLGGLFSDDMGLGKTLSILSLIASTKDAATAFGLSPLPKELLKDSNIEQNTGATLLVCPTGVISNWDEQIRDHMAGIKYYKYYGTKRTRNVKLLASFDIVITSYQTLANEMTRSNSAFNALSRLNWYRVVLDEAHTIKNMQTNAFKGCCSIASPRRWAVTGTPVQNRLDDLGALVKFMKLVPFHEKANWELSFLAKFKSGDSMALDNLKALVGSVMLRRSKKKINIEDPDRYTIELEFSPTERALYEAFMKDSGNKVNAILSDGRLRGKGTAHMLTFITRLRLICCHGRELLSDEDMKVLEGRTVEDAIDIGGEDDLDKPLLTDHEIYNTLSLMRDTSVNQCTMTGCTHWIGNEDPATEANQEESEDDEDDTDKDNVKDDAPLGYMTACYKLLCNKHVDKYKATVAASITTDRYCDCSLCETYHRAALAPITRSGIDAEIERKHQATLNRQNRGDGTYTGPHTKVRALIERLEQNAIESLALPAGEPPIRSVVFSGWTTYMDLIGIGLEDAGIPFLRLDGSMHVRRRAKVIEQFRSDPTYAVLLVSIKAGGQGLNFTAANKVYMMEPQFNPGVENQAVDRVHRIGQTRKVEVVKFVMRDSFEGRIIKLQEQKMALAREAFGEGGKGGLKERMEGLRSLFR
ncbi:hypothetical protein CAC42_4958 [Sphaceloma murrayae]|uniref:Uncharacterized protein n=1 Tax=Sphaceloma murrayae TaxID=2082308 RepID=A0A2K1QPF8_9PEZI|nr:hypothetical protein CAC42_4958 [Sphaceloma murrayae]